MKFLLLISRNPNAGMPTAEQFLAHKEWVRRKVREGVMESPYSYPVTGGGFVILSGTVEEVNALADQAPLRGFGNVELHPLIDFYDEMDRVAAALRR